MFKSGLVRRVALAGLMAPAAMAHCDGIDGPVVLDARRALEKGKVNLVLLWVRASDELAVQEAFARAQEVRKLGGEAQRLADQFFFETVVRFHREGEGESFSGLKPPGQVLDKAIQRGDQALATGDLKPVWELLQEEAHQGLHHRFQALREALRSKDEDPAAGRRYVAAYVEYIHYVVNLHRLASGSSEATRSAAPSPGCGHAE